MVTLSLIRHGQTDWNLNGIVQGLTDIASNDTGRQEACMAGAALSHNTYQAIFSSPLTRTKETANIIAAEVQGPKPIENDAFIERNYGAAESLTTAEIQRRWPDGNVPGRQTRGCLLARVTPMLHQIAQEASDTDHLLIVTHGGVIGSLVRVLTNYYLPHPNEVISNGSIHDFEYQNGQLNLKRFNVDPRMLLKRISS